MNYDDFEKALVTEYDYGFSGNFESPEIVVETENDRCISVYPVDGGLMCSHLDNVIYDDVDDIASDLYEYLSRNRDVVTTVNFE